MFRDVDCDGSGEVSTKELAQYFSLLGKESTPQQISNLMASVSPRHVAKSTINFDQFTRLLDKFRTEHFNMSLI